MQAGFLHFQVIPTWDLVSTVFPATEPLLIRAKENKTAWANYEETKEDEQVYIKKPQKLVMSRQATVAVAEVTEDKAVKDAAAAAHDAVVEAIKEKTADIDKSAGYQEFIKKLAPTMTKTKKEK